MRKLILIASLLFTLTTLTIDSFAASTKGPGPKVPKKVENAFYSHAGSLSSWLMSEYGAIVVLYVSEQGKTSDGNYYYNYQYFVDPSSMIMIFPETLYIEIKPNGEIVEYTSMGVITSAILKIKYSSEA
jgi:hypothetical protein